MKRFPRQFWTVASGNLERQSLLTALWMDISCPIGKDVIHPAGTLWRLPETYHLITPDLWIIASRVVQFLHWHNEHRFCNKCGTETVGQAVRCEIMEKTGIEVTDIQYVANQPWPFLSLTINAWIHSKIPKWREQGGRHAGVVAFKNEYRQDFYCQVSPGKSVSSTLLLVKYSNQVTKFR